MSKQKEQMPVRYRQLGSGQGTDFYFERSLDLIFSPGTFTVEIDHTSANVGLPIEFCGGEHYIVGTLIVTDSGNTGTTQKNRITGQILMFTDRESSETKLYTRTFVGGEWGGWRSLAFTGMYNNISTTDELLASVDALVGVTKQLQTEFATEVTKDKKLLCKTYTPNDYYGLYCSNVTTGEIKNATANNNAFLVKVSPGEIYRVEGDSFLNIANMPFFSDVPTIENYSGVHVGYKPFIGGLVVVPKDAVYMLVSVKNAATATARIELVGWGDRIVSNAVATAHCNLGSEYVERSGSLNAGVALDMRHFYNLTINEGDALEFIAETDSNVKYRILTGNGMYVEGNSIYYDSNVLYRVYAHTVFVTSLRDANRWGLFVAAADATANTSIRFRARIISNDAFSYDSRIREQALQLENINNSVIETNEAINRIAVIPNNNNYLIDWEDGNKAVIRLYIENKELALTNNLYLRTIYRQLNGNIKHCGFNLYEGATMYKTVAPYLSEFEIYEYTDAKYGKVAIRMSWESIKVGSVIDCGIRYISNLKDIVFDWEEFVKPLEPTAKIADNYISEDSFDEELKEKINSPVPALSQYELFSLGDSLSSGGTWQTKVAELTGCLFDQSKNVKAGAMLSVGGTSSYGVSFDNVLWRTKNLIDCGYIAGEGDNAIVIFENGNDGYKVFDETERTIVPTAPIEGYAYEDFGTDLLASITNKAQLNAVLRLTKTSVGKNLKIESLPTKEGDITLYVGWAGPGRSYYNVHVVPQATDAATLQYVLDKIMEYSYTGMTDVLGEDGISVDFSNGNANYPVTLEFTDTGNTGMRVSITDNPNAKTSVAKYFIGDSVDEWTDVSKWQEGITYSQGWKSSIELLQRIYPKLHIFVSHFPHHSVTASEYLLPNGAYDSASYDKVSRMEMMRNMEVELKKIAEFYSLPFLNVFRECGIGINNMLSYYNASANVHPKNEGYYRFGETVATQLKRYI